MPKYLVPLSYISFFRYSLSALLIAVFGMDRCSYEHWLAELKLDMTNLTRPQWLRTMSLVFEYQKFLGGSDDENDDYVLDTGADTEPEDNIMIMFGGKSTVGNNTVKSLILSQFEMDDSVEAFWTEIKFLSIFVLITYVLVYIILVWKVGRKR